MFWLIAVFVVSLVLAFAFQPKPQTTPPPGINELNVPLAEEGLEIPVLFGTRDLLAPNVVWYGDLQLKPIKKKGGKK
jgi:hypothetical protein